MKKKIRDPLCRTVELVSREQIDFIKENTDVAFEFDADWACFKMYHHIPPIFFADFIPFVTISCETFIQEFFPELQELKMREFKVGDTVYDVLRQEHGVVEDVKYGDVYSLSVRFDAGEGGWYTADGRFFGPHKIRALYHEDEEPQQLRKPGKPAPTIKPGTIVEVRKRCGEAYRLAYATGETSAQGIYVTERRPFGVPACYSDYRIIREPSE